MADTTETSMSTWSKVMALKANGKAEAKGVLNLLSKDNVNTVVGTIDFFGGDYRQDIFDLWTAKYRVFDWLAMRVQGRNSGSASDIAATKVLVYSFLKVDGVPSKFIQDLRETDYDINTEWEKIEL